MTEISFHHMASDGLARRACLKTAHGDVQTPAFMPVGTAASVKALYPDQVKQAGSDIILGNTYHLMLRPGAQRVKRLGGLRRFMRWDGPILTDSGGFQVWSLKGLRKLEENGIVFRSHIDGSEHRLTPESATAIQADMLGSDISMQLDECTPHPVSHTEAARSMHLSLRWAKRCKAAFGHRSAQALFGIVQGSVYPDLRTQSAHELMETGFDGYAIGGLAVGEGHDAMCEVLQHIVPQLPPDKPRYLMGVGKPRDIVAAVLCGVDMFDCVLPTRSGRHGQAWTWAGPINLKNARFAEDDTPLDPTSSCPASRDWSKAYLHHLFKTGEYLGPMLLSWHNIGFFQALMQRLRLAISENRLAEECAALQAGWS